MDAARDERLPGAQLDRHSQQRVCGAEPGSGTPSPNCLGARGLDGAGHDHSVAAPGLVCLRFPGGRGPMAPSREACPCRPHALSRWLGMPVSLLSSSSTPRSSRERVDSGLATRLSCACRRGRRRAWARAVVLWQPVFREPVFREPVFRELSARSPHATCAPTTIAASSAPEREARS